MVRTGPSKIPLEGFQLCRRRLLQLAFVGTATAVAGPALAVAPTRRLAMRNLHTDEWAEATYWSDGRYVPKALARINVLLRDHRREEVHPIAPSLLDLLHRLAQGIGTEEPFHVVSGYRSPQTNAMLGSKSSAVAKRSFHMRGQAVDIRLPCCGLQRLHRLALALDAGGVGLYRRSNFIHVDVGPVRQWVG
jgi:uncharacterized protein YcbK (DUF882 family)